MAAAPAVAHLRQTMAKRFRILATALATAFGALAMPAFAQVTAYAAGQGAVNSVSVAIDVRASVSNRCGFAAGGAPAGSISQAEFDRTGFARDFAIALDCTGASRIAVTSRNGGLATAGAAAPGYATVAPYQVELRMVGDDGTAATGACDASTLGAAGGCAFAGTAGTANGLRLAAASTRANGSYLRVSAPAYAGSAPLIAGQYADTLTVTVSIAP